MQSEKVVDLHKSDKLNIRIHSSNNSTFFGTPYATETTIDLIAELNNAEYKEEIYYINNTYKTISLMNRNGIVISVPYTSSCSSRDFIIRKVLQLKKHSLESLVRYIQSLSDLDNAELLQIKKLLININLNTLNGCSIMFEYRVTIEELKKYAGTLYHYNTDLVISFSDIISINQHPYSNQFVNIGSFGVENDYSQQTEFNIKLRYVNHESNATPVFVNLLGKVFTLYPQKDGPARKLKLRDKSGKSVYSEFKDYLQIFYSSKNDPDGNNPNGVTPIKLSIEEAKETIGLFNTYSEAVYASNSEINRKEELLRLTHQLEILRHENSIDKTKLEREDLERKSILAKESHELELQRKQIDAEAIRLKHQQTKLDEEILRLENEKRELELKRRKQEDKINRENKFYDEQLKRAREENETRLKAEQQYWKDYYETKQQMRKDTMDLVKFIPGLIVAAGAVYMAWSKLKKDN